MADLGYIVILFAFALSLYSAFAAGWGRWRGYPELVVSARNGAYAVLGLLLLASAALVYAFVTHDFSIEYVASYSERDMPMFYKVLAFWAGNKGSLLFWSTTMALFTAILLWQQWPKKLELLPYSLMVLMGVGAFFLALMVFVSNPFERLPFVPADGMGLNPLLQNPGMTFHPPTQLLGYMGFTIPFAFAIAALLSGRVGDEWIVITRRWTLIAWVFLGLGNWFGAVWAYTVLGWGGYWGWDPVENAGLLPWLTGTAFLHSAMIQKRRGMLKVWNMVLIIVTFLLSIFGTFLTRSGLLASVHAFGLSAMGPFFLAFIGLVGVGSFALLFYRLPRLRSEDELDSFVSRESSFLFNNLILVGIAFAVFWGTIFPVISEAVRGTKITVGPPFYNAVNGPIFLVLLILMGICPLIGWRRASPSNLVRNFVYSLSAAIITAVVLYILGARRWAPLLGFSICAFVIVSILLEWVRGSRARHRTRGENYLRAFFALLASNRPRYGGYIVHLSVIFIAIGVLGSYFYKTESEVTLNPGQTATVGGYELKFEGLKEYPTETRQVTRATLSLYNGGRFAGVITPSTYTHKNHPSPVTDIALKSSLKEDLYVILGNWDSSGQTTFKILINPLVQWIWIGGVVMVGGTIFALWPERKRRK